MKKIREVKIYVDGRSKEIQEKLFELDKEIRWDFSEGVKNTDVPFLYVEKSGKLDWSGNMDKFINHPFTELKADEILAMEPEYEFKPFERVLTKILEEVGEVAKEINEINFNQKKDISNYRKELIQVCAVAVARLEKMIELVDKN